MLRLYKGPTLVVCGTESTTVSQVVSLKRSLTLIISFSVLFRRKAEGQVARGEVGCNPSAKLLPDAEERIFRPASMTCRHSLLSLLIILHYADHVTAQHVCMYIAWAVVLTTLSEFAS